MTFFFSISIAIPIFINDSELFVSVEMSESVSFSCAAEGVPSPVITWIKYGGGIFEGNSNKNENILITNIPLGMMVKSTLTINSTVLSDSSTYICMASNNVGSVNSASVVLTVTGQLHKLLVMLR